MKPGIPWSVKGIEPDAREAAKDAARRRGMTLGAWLNTVIMEQSDSGEARPASRDSLQNATGDFDTQSRLDELAAQLAALSRQDHQAMASRLPDDVQSPKDLNRILERIDATERETVEARREARSNGFPYNKHSYTAEWKVVADLPGWLSLSQEIATYSGGAHGNTTVESLVWDKQAARSMNTIALFVSPAALEEALGDRFCEALDRERARRRGEAAAPEPDDPFYHCPKIDELEVLVGSSNRRSSAGSGAWKSPGATAMTDETLSVIQWLLWS